MSDFTSFVADLLGKDIHDSSDVEATSRKTLKFNGNFTVSDSGGKTLIELSGTGVGETNTASSQGSGVSVYYQKSGVDLQFNAIKSENDRIAVALDAGTHDVELTLTEGNIVHQNLSGAGSNTHAQVDSHIASTANPHSTDIGNLGSGTLAELNAAVSDATLDTSSASRPPSGSASGDLGGSYPSPTVTNFTYLGRAGTEATAGAIRLVNADWQYWRNNANDGNLGFRVNSSDNLEFNVVLDLQDNAILDLDYIGRAGAEASAGAVRLTNTDWINWRNAGNDGDFGIQLDANDNFVFSTSIDMSDKDIIDARTISYEQLKTLSGSGGTVNWTLGQKWQVTMTGAGTLTFTAPPGPCDLRMTLINAGANAPTWPGTVKWPGGTEPSWTSSGTDVVGFFYDGTNYHGGANLDSK